MGIFKVVNGVLTLSREELRAIPEYRRVLEADKGSEGDADGRKKYRSFKEFMYIFSMYDYESPNAKLPEEIRRERSIKDAELEAGFKPSKILRDAIKRYVEDQDNLMPSIKILRSLERGLSMSDKIVTSLVSRMEKTLADADKKAEESEGLVQVDITSMITDINTLMTLANKIPDTLDSIEKVKEKVMTEKGNGRTTVRGGMEKGNREDPGYILTKFKSDATDS